MKLRGGSIVSSYQIKEIPISFNRTINNTDSNLNNKTTKKNIKCKK